MAQAFLKHCKNNVKNKIRELEGQELENLFSVYYKNDSKYVQNIMPKIKDGSVNIESILHDSKEDLIAEFDFDEDADKNNFLTLRDTLRKFDISQREKLENLTEKLVKTLSWDGVCHLFEQEVASNMSIAKSQKWYKYFEENGINGSALIKKDPDQIQKALELNEGEKCLLDDLMEKIQPDNDAKNSSINIKGSSVGFIKEGRGTAHITGDITVNNKN